MRIWRGEPGRRIVVGLLGLVAVSFGGALAGYSAVGEVNPVYRSYQTEHRRSFYRLGSTSGFVAPLNASSGSDTVFNPAASPEAPSDGRDQNLSADYLERQTDLERDLSTVTGYESPRQTLRTAQAVVFDQSDETSADEPLSGRHDALTPPTADDVRPVPVPFAEQVDFPAAQLEQ